jgi:ABC-type uncharacterized transport system involved in gliding motility auxiliary subunit
MTGPRRFLTLTLLAVGLIGLVAANSLVYFTRVDLTENRLHTIADATRELISGLEDEVSITYYLSERLSERFPQPREIVDLLNEYRAASRGNVRVRVVDPTDLDRPEEVEALGVVPQQLQITEEGEQRLAVVYSGIVVEYLDHSEVVPFVFSSTTLEYDLTTAIRSLALDESRSLAFILGDGSQSLERSYRFAATELSRSYDVRSIRRGEPVPDDVDVAVVTDAHLLTEDELGPVMDYLDRGGSLLVTVERAEVDLGGGLAASRVADPAAFGALEERGVTVGEGLLLDESHTRIRIQEVSAEFSVTRAYPYPHWPATLEQYTDPDHPVTARYTGLDLYWPTFLEARGNASVLVASTPQAWLMREPFVLNPQLSAQFVRDAAETRGQYGLVAVSTGTKATVESADDTVAANGRLAVVADADFLRDELLEATGSAQNIEFVQNLAQWLSADESLLAIRTRASRNLSLQRIDDPAARRAAIFVAHAVNIVIVPGAVVAYGLVRLARRRSRARLGGSER